MKNCLKFHLILYRISIVIIGAIIIVFDKVKTMINNYSFAFVFDPSFTPCICNTHTVNAKAIAYNY